MKNILTISFLFITIVSFAQREEDIELISSREIKIEQIKNTRKFVVNQYTNIKLPPLICNNYIVVLTGGIPAQFSGNEPQFQ